MQLFTHHMSAQYGMWQRRLCNAAALVTTRLQCFIYPGVTSSTAPYTPTPRTREEMHPLDATRGRGGRECCYSPILTLSGHNVLGQKRRSRLEQCSGCCVPVCTTKPT